jgi:hypothetical protein
MLLDRECAELNKEVDELENRISNVKRLETVKL